MEVVTTRDLGNRMRVRFAGMFDAIKGMPPANPTAPEVVPFLDVTPCLKCTRGRYCSAACQEFTEQSGGYFEVERLVERGQACWQSLSERDHSLCDASVRSWRELARKHGHDRSMYALGFVHEHGRGVAQSDAEAQRWYKAAGKLREAQARLGNMLRDGRGSRPCDKKALVAFRGAALQGDADAYYNVGKLRLAGRGGPEPSTSAGLALIEASNHRDRSHARAQTALGLCRMRAAQAAQVAEAAEAAAEDAAAAAGGGGARRSRVHSQRPASPLRGSKAANEADAAALWLSAAQSGYPRAQYNYALLLEKGRGGLAADPDGAIGWWRRAADQGHAGALYCLALRFMQRHGQELGAKRAAGGGGGGEGGWGEGGCGGGSGGGSGGRGGSRVPGMPASAREAVRLWRRAAEQRHGGALLMLALCVERGWGGCARDPRQALEMAQQALDEGYLPAQQHLDRLRDPKKHRRPRSANASAASSGASTFAPGSEAGRFSASTSPFWRQGDVPMGPD